MHRLYPRYDTRREAAADRGAPAAFTAQAISSLRSKEGDKKRAELTEQVRARLLVPCALVCSPVQPESRLGFPDAPALRCLSQAAGGSTPLHLTAQEG